MKQLEQLLIISEAQYQQQRQALVQLNQQEARLRQDLERLSQMRSASRNQDSVALNSMRAVGADVLWSGWLGRAKSELNMRLARVLAAKEDERAKVRRAFGKTIALQELLEDEKKQRRKKQAQAALSTAIERSLFPSGGRQ